MDKYIEFGNQSIKVNDNKLISKLDLHKLNNSRIMNNNNLLSCSENTPALFGSSNMKSEIEDEKRELIFKTSPNPFGEEFNFNNSNIFNSPNINNIKSDIIDQIAFNMYKKPSETEEGVLMKSFTLSRRSSFDMHEMFKNENYNEKVIENENPMIFDESYFSISSENDKK